MPIEQEQLINSASLPPSTPIAPLLITKILPNSYEFLVRGREKYGDIYQLKLGILNPIILNHPKHADYVFRKNVRNYEKDGPMWEAVRTLIGEYGLPAAKGENWRRHRRMIQPQFHMRRLRALTAEMIEGIEDGMKTWDAVAESKEPFDIFRAFNTITLKVIIRAMFGTYITDEEAKAFDVESNIANDGMFTGMMSNKLPNWIPVPGAKRYEQAVERLDEILYRVIDRSQADENKDGHDLVSMLLSLIDDETGEGLSRQELRDETLTMFLAGYETTSVTLSWVAHLLTQHPEYLQAVQAQVDEVLGQRQPTMADIENLPLLKWSIQESMRLYPPSFFLGRHVLEDDIIDGYLIPKDSMVVVMTCAMHRHPDVWEKPDEFDPYRFSPERSANRPNYALLPFGLGKRMCIGDRFALLEAQLVLAKILQRYNLRPAHGLERKVHLAITLQAKDGIHVYLEKRPEYTTESS